MEKETPGVGAEAAEQPVPPALMDGRTPVLHGLQEAGRWRGLQGELSLGPESPYFLHWLLVCLCPPRGASGPLPLFGRPLLSPLRVAALRVAGATSSPGQIPPPPCLSVLVLIWKMG